jgi:hypothetical protein
MTWNYGNIISERSTVFSSVTLKSLYLVVVVIKRQSWKKCMNMDKRKEQALNILIVVIQQFCKFHERSGAN